MLLALSPLMLAEFVYVFATRNSQATADAHDIRFAEAGELRSGWCCVVLQTLFAKHAG